MKFYVPSIGDQIRLLEPWRFRLYSDSINADFVYRLLGCKKTTDWDQRQTVDLRLKFVNYDIEKLPHKPPITLKMGSPQFKVSYCAKGDFIIAILPRGVILTINRIYIRQGKSDYDSITFSIPKELNKEFKDLYGRFWAKLSDINRVQFEKFIPGKNSWVSSVYDEYGKDEFNFLEL